MTLSEQFAQVRAGIPAPHAASNRYEHRNALAALSSIERHVQDVDARLAALYAANEQLHRDRDLMIERSAAWRVRAESSERHVQDMESAIEEWAFDQGYDSLSAERIAVDIRNRAAALPAREKEEE